MIQYLYSSITFLVYGNLESCLSIALNDGNMAWCGLYYKRNATHVGTALSLIGWYYNLFGLFVFGLLVSIFFSFQMIYLIHKYKLT